ncbi:PASTA domain-containing protein [Ferruginibacter sp. SUN106]|uniref:PASTA domain-containing protein n=1 Tax=Ferruginibacter sp. SUN106 TaxID=2978348 RepID=UPI003D362A8A
MFNFITKRPLWVNIVAAAILTFLLVFLFLKMLGWITKHDAYLQVPDLLGKKTEEAIKILEKQGFEVQIQDSVFTDTAARGVVLKQLPDANAKVKINRTVFLTVNRVTPPMVDMPKLEDQSLSFALDILRRNHLLLGDTIFKTDYRLNTVIEQQYNGVRIPEKAKVQWGSKITLVIGSGLGNEKIMVPSLIGMTYNEAKAFLEQQGIILASVIPYHDAVIRDTAAAFVVQQNPESLDQEKKPRFMQSGQLMDLWISPVMINLTDSLDVKKENK